jgi:hypothetical protein
MIIRTFPPPRALDDIIFLGPLPAPSHAIYRYLSFGSFGQWILYTNATMALHLLYFAACMCEVNLTMDSAMASLEGDSGIRSYPHPTGPRE